MVYIDKIKLVTFKYVSCVILFYQCLNWKQIEGTVNMWREIYVPEANYTLNPIDKDRYDYKRNAKILLKKKRLSDHPTPEIELRNQFSNP